MENNICLLLLVGLPGCGKTTLCKKLLSNKDSKYSHIKFIHVSFDDHIPLVDQEKFAVMRQKQENVNTDDTWKNARYQLLLSIEEMVGALKSKTINEATKEFINIEKVEDQLFVVLLDDNFYYKSMRYEYYQMARRQTVGYCQVYIECSVSDASQNNAQRDSQIPDSVIQVMAERMQIPLAQNLTWEKNSIKLLANYLDHNLEGVFNLVSNCLNNPVSPLEDREEEITHSKLQCSESLAHQADIILRSLVGTIIKEAKATNEIIPSDFSKFSKNVNVCRQKVLTNLKNGVTLLTHHLANNATTTAKEEFRDFLRQELENHLNDN